MTTLKPEKCTSHAPAPHDNKSTYAGSGYVTRSISRHCRESNGAEDAHDNVHN